jgi:hypothetical protein
LHHDLILHCAGSTAYGLKMTRSHCQFVVMMYDDV